MALGNKDKAWIKSAIVAAVQAMPAAQPRKNRFKESPKLIKEWDLLKDDYIDSTVDGTSPGELNRVNATMRAKIKNLMHSCRSDQETDLYREMAVFAKKVYI